MNFYTKLASLCATSFVLAACQTAVPSVTAEAPTTSNYTTSWLLMDWASSSPCHRATPSFIIKKHPLVECQKRRGHLNSNSRIRSSLPISCKYLSRDALSRFVIDLVILSCLMIPTIWLTIFYESFIKIYFNVFFTAIDLVWLL